MKILKLIVHLIANISYVLIFIYVLVEVPIIFGYKPLIVLSGSMTPTYKVGSILYYHNVPEKELEVGDVITFVLEDDTHVTHRIKSIENGQYETKGDANNSPDALKINYKNIKGKVSKLSIPLLGSCYLFFIEHHVVIVSILVIILLAEFALSNIKMFNNEKREEVKK